MESKDSKRSRFGRFSASFRNIAGNTDLDELLLRCPGKRNGDPLKFAAMAFWICGRLLTLLKENIAGVVYYWLYLYRHLKY